jgi:hypothetical protein
MADMDIVPARSLSSSSDLESNQAAAIASQESNNDSFVVAVTEKGYGNKPTIR